MNDFINNFNEKNHYVFLERGVLSINLFYEDGNMSEFFDMNTLGSNVDELVHWLNDEEKFNDKPFIY